MSEDILATRTLQFVERPYFKWRSASSAAIKPHLLPGAFVPEGIDPQTMPPPTALRLYAGSSWNERRPTCI
jgi:hypothetical protein